jgi:hypothetical protein
MTRIVCTFLLILTLTPLIWLSACRATQPVAPATAANSLFFSTNQAADKIVVMHVESDSLLNRVRSGDWQSKWAKIKAEFPNAVFFAKELEKKSFD